MSELLPAEVEARLEAFLADGKYGTVTLEVVNGSIESAKFTDGWRRQRAGTTNNR